MVSIVYKGRSNYAKIGWTDENVCEFYYFQEKMINDFDIVNLSEGDEFDSEQGYYTNTERLN